MPEMETKATSGFAFLLYGIMKLELCLVLLIGTLKQVLSHSSLVKLSLCCAGPRVGSGKAEAERVTHPWGVHQP